MQPQKSTFGRDIVVITASIILASVIAAVFHPIVKNTSQNLGGVEGAASYTLATQSTSKLITTTSSTVVATNTARTYLELANINATNAIYCNMDNGKPAVANQGIMLGTTTNTGRYTLSLANYNMYKGAISCVTQQGSASTTVYEHN